VLGRTSRNAEISCSPQCCKTRKSAAAQANTVKRGNELFGTSKTCKMQKSAIQHKQKLEDVRMSWESAKSADVQTNHKL
jgi:hypothetical protein